MGSIKKNHTAYQTQGLAQGEVKESSAQLGPWQTCLLGKSDVYMRVELLRSLRLESEAEASGRPVQLGRGSAHDHHQGRPGALLHLAA